VPGTLPMCPFPCFFPGQPLARLPVSLNSHSTQENNFLTRIFSSAALMGLFLFLPSASCATGSPIPVSIFLFYLPIIPFPPSPHMITLRLACCHMHAHLFLFLSSCFYDNGGLRSWLCFCVCPDSKPVLLVFLPLFAFLKGCTMFFDTSPIPCRICTAQI